MIGLFAAVDELGRVRVETDRCLAHEIAHIRVARLTKSSGNDAYDSLSCTNDLVRDTFQGVQMKKNAVLTKG